MRYVWIERIKGCNGIYCGGQECCYGRGERVVLHPVLQLKWSLAAEFVEVFYSPPPPSVCCDSDPHGGGRGCVTVYLLRSEEGKDPDVWLLSPSDVVSIRKWHWWGGTISFCAGSNLPCLGLSNSLRHAASLDGVKFSIFMSYLLFKSNPSASGSQPHNRQLKGMKRGKSWVVRQS